MNRGDFRNENKFERARERVPLLPVRSRLGVIIFLATADRPFGPTIKQTIDRPFESNYKLVLPFSRLSNTLRSLSSRGQNLPLSFLFPFPSIPSFSFFLFSARGREEEEKEWTIRNEERSAAFGSINFFCPVKVAWCVIFQKLLDRFPRVFPFHETRAP